MGRLLVFMTVSTNGFFEGTNHDISWHNVDEEVHQFAIELLAATDTILFGRRTYQLFEDFWPKIPDDSTTPKPILEIAHLINNVNKIVYSKTLDRVQEKNNWKNVKLAREVDPGEISRLKRERDKNLTVGGSNLAVTLAELGLIDEVQIMISPVVLEEGTPLLQGIRKKLALKLLRTRVFNSGNVLLCYETLKH